MRQRIMLFGGVALVALVVVAAAVKVYADSAAQITVGGCGLQYVKHENNLPAGLTTLLVRNAGGLQQVRIKFSARAEDGSNLARTIDTSLRSGETRKFQISWGKAITDLNFIQIIPVGGCKKPDDGSGSNSH